jgi:hypothetical protein
MSTLDEGDITAESAPESSTIAGKRQFSVVSLLMLQAVAGTAVFIAKFLGVEYLIVVVVILIMVSIPVVGSIWVANNFQRAEQVFSKVIVAYWAIYLVAAAASFLGLWQFLDL